MSQIEVPIEIDLSQGASLDWLIAQAEQVQVFVSASASGIKTCWRKDKPNQQYSPTSRWRHCGHLLDKYDVDFERAGEQIRASCPAISGVERIQALGPDRITASCRAIAKAVFGSVGSIPAELTTTA